MLGSWGGFNPQSYIERLVFPFSGTSVTAGNINTSRYNGAGVNSTVHGFVMGGLPSGSTRFSSIERITFPFTSGTSTSLGNLTGSRMGNTGTDGTDFVGMFV